MYLIKTEKIVQTKLGSVNQAFILKQRNLKTKLVEILNA